MARVKILVDTDERKLTLIFEQPRPSKCSACGLITLIPSIEVPLEDKDMACLENLENKTVAVKIIVECGHCGNTQNDFIKLGDNKLMPDAPDPKLSS